MDRPRRAFFKEHQMDRALLEEKYRNACEGAATVFVGPEEAEKRRDFVAIVLALVLNAVDDTLRPTGNE